MSGETYRFINMDSPTLQAYHLSLACHHSVLLEESNTTKTHSKSSFCAYIISAFRLITRSFTILTSHTTTALNQPIQSKMPSQTRDYASSTYSVSTTCSYEKPSQKSAKTKRSLKQRMKDAVKDIGTSPFEHDEREKQSFAWAASMPPSRL
ncbi:hypothetical protein KVR01_005389 [Diaporthe batatas]|uniref:uncharacterized protein n=1 Tax=Diaporthe batatas TaxID=748121 RepID=UPI001D0367CD|nr:uncharacterized protein KVR01_005389 [Diaporthe batatas]KAG8165114.1 hypothetical protein KVR01_005389 [Diaporthe batatas]